METVEYELWYLDPVGHSTKQGKNEEAFSRLTCKALQNVLLISAERSTVRLRCHTSCENGRRGCGLCRLCTKNPGRRRKKRKNNGGGGWGDPVDGGQKWEGDFAGYHTVSVGSRCYNKRPHTGCLLATDTSFSQFQRLGNLGVWCGSTT